MNDTNDFEYDGKNFDRMFHASLSRFYGWLLPPAYILAYVDWLGDLSLLPAKQQDLRNNAIQKLARFFLYATKFSANETESVFPFANLIIDLEMNHGTNFLITYIHNLFC